MKLNRIAVTGSQGFLGSEIITKLGDSGHEVVRLSHSKINYYNVESLAKELKGVEILIHAGWAGISKEARENIQIQEQNVIIAKNLIEACKKAQVTRVVGLGSQAEFGNQRAPFDDDQKTLPTTPYGIAKCTVHNLLRRSGIKVTWARIFSAYGEGDKRDWIFTKAISAIVKQEILKVGPCSQLWSFTHKTDIAFGIKWIIDNEINDTVNLSSTESRSLRSYLEKLQTLAGQTSLIEFSQNLSTQHDIYPSQGRLYYSGWKPKISIDQGFIRSITEFNKTSTNC